MVARDGQPNGGRNPSHALLNLDRLRVRQAADLRTDWSFKPAELAADWSRGQRVNEGRNLLIAIAGTFDNDLRGL
jgi:hypothetical protein